jgi:hypothetical protein
VKSTLYSVETNPDEWFAELLFIRRRLEEDNKCNTFGEVEMINQIVYNTKPAACQMQLTVIKKEAARKKKDSHSECEVTLDSVMDENRIIFESLHPSKPNPHPKGSVTLVATPTPKGKRFPKQFKKSCSLCGKQGHKSDNCYSRRENAQRPTKGH